MACATALTHSLDSLTRTHTHSHSQSQNQGQRVFNAGSTHASGLACTLHSPPSERASCLSRPQQAGLTRPVPLTRAAPLGAWPGCVGDKLKGRHFLLTPQRSQGPGGPRRVVAEAKPRGRDTSTSKGANTTEAKQPTGGSKCSSLTPQSCSLS